MNKERPESHERHILGAVYMQVLHEIEQGRHLLSVVLKYVVS